MTEPAQPAIQRRHWWLPSISIAIWLVFFLALNLSARRHELIGTDGDPCLHWRIGNWMIENRAVIRTDQFSHTRFDAPLVSKEWLSEVLFAAAGNALGWGGVVLLTAALIATCFWLLHRQLLAEGNELLLATLLVMVAAAACSMHWLARPHLFTHLFTVIYAWQLRAFNRNSLPAKLLLLRLTSLMILWVNLHGAFFTGFVLIGIYILGNCLSLVSADRDQRTATKGKIATLLVLMGFCLVVSLANPNGWKLHAQIVDFLRSPWLVGLVNEFASPNFHSPIMRGFLLQLLLLLAMLVTLRPRLCPTDIMLIGVWAYFALHSARNVPIFALVATPILGEHLNAGLRNAGDSALARLYRKISGDVTALDRSASGRTLAMAVVVAMLLIATKPRLWGGPPILAVDVSPSFFPAAAVRYLTDHPDGVTGEMFNAYGWGGYLMLYLPTRKVFIDGRNDFYGQEFVREFLDAQDVRPNWENIFAKYDVGWTILPPNHPLCSILALRTDWKLVHRDAVAVIYARVGERAPHSSD
jgi:hypothetical protein